MQEKEKFLMTIDECKKYLPNRWAEIIQQDPLLMEIVARQVF